VGNCWGDGELRGGWWKSWGENLGKRCAEEVAGRQEVAVGGVLIFQSVSKKTTQGSVKKSGFSLWFKPRPIP
jgi:hypothetical protein